MGTEAEGTAPATTDPATPPATPVAPPATPEPAPQPPAEPPAATPPAPQGGDPNWLAARLQREREASERRLAKDLGFTVAEAKEKLVALRKLEDAQKSDTERLTERNTTLEARAKRADELEATIKARADIEMAALTEAQWNRRQAAQLLGISYSSLRRRIGKYNLKTRWLGEHCSNSEHATL